MCIFHQKRIVSSVLTIGIGTLAYGQDALETLEPLEVIGSKERIAKMVGSSAYLDTEDIRTQGYTNINRILSRVPGVYVREEDGFGNFPNISIRGGDGTRSEKVTVMEDGILTAPAPYSAPAAYYFPRGARMSAIEVMKGSSQIRFGPNTTGGVLNFISTRIPGSANPLDAPIASDKGGLAPATGDQIADPNFYWRSTYGRFNTFHNHAYYGNTVETENGRFGYLLEIHQHSTDGFRRIQGGGGDTGFQLFEPMVKVFWEPNTALKQRFEIKAGYTSFDADETYLGLTENDARNSPRTSYQATRFDNIDTEHWRTYLKWIAQPTRNSRIESSLYFNDFSRNWYKVAYSSLDTSGAVDARGRIANGRTSLHQGLLDPAMVGVLQGTTNGSIGVRANNRTYESYGWQTNASLGFDTGQASHILSGGIRFHYDNMDRAQWDDIYVNTGGGFNRVRNGLVDGFKGEESNRREESTAFSAFLEDEINYGALTVKPGIRYEHVRQTRTNRPRGGQGPAAYNVAKNTIDALSGGMGFRYDFTDADQVFGGVYRGISLPSPNAAIGGTDIEESIGYELGYRHRKDFFAAEFVAFFTDFDNMIGTDAGLGLGGPQTNAGQAEVWGFEGLLSYDYAAARGMSFSTPSYISATWTSAELKSNIISGGGDDLFAGSSPGSAIPYIPEWAIAMGTGYATERWGINIDATYTSSTFGTGDNVTAPITTSRQGKTDAIFLLDISAYYQVNNHLRLVGGVQNVLNKEAITTRIPEGPRTLAPVTAYTGFELTF